MGIDFVLLWVDGNDPNWLKEFKKYKNLGGDNRELRFRDWGNLKYLFRAFEKYTPWVRKIHFVTWGHLPKWLNADHEKINIVFHENFLKKEYLPVFNSHAIEVNLHRIKDLSNKFVYFNDDTFILKPLSKDRFFKKGLPCDMLVFNAIFLDSISHIRLNDIEIINKYFNKRKILKKLFFKIFNLKYSYHQIRSLLLLPWPQFTGFYDHHQPQSFLKKTFEEVWEKEKEILEKTSASKIRDINQVNQYLFRYWQLLKGNFIPISFHDSKSISVTDINSAIKIAKLIRKRKYALFCINDNLQDHKYFEKAKNIINEAFEEILPKKSEFEL